MQITTPPSDSYLTPFQTEGTTTKAHFSGAALVGN